MGLFFKFEFQQLVVSYFWVYVTLIHLFQHLLLKSGLFNNVNTEMVHKYILFYFILFCKCKNIKTAGGRKLNLNISLSCLGSGINSVETLYMSVVSVNYQHFIFNFIYWLKIIRFYIRNYASLITFSFIFIFIFNLITMCFNEL